jgi:hypothetical protein
MTDTNQDQKDRVEGKPVPDPEEKPEATPEAPKWEAELDTYPLRQPSEDPRWAVRTVGCWVVVTFASLAFILALIILGAIYD